ncbi:MULTISPECIES: GTPase [unclassified Enterococcus]|uniref:GTPase n=1 Tax=unclassified Enterococcus TaxID=2608891 RepID=UPI001CE1BBCA|nr:MULTISPECIES: GTPase [unclassified Enterococcus]MCA5012071.1 50S ribosome-binding GTPase [Enterococcus sp. S23]MCA5015322.1 50S ribosome-binding GTPase [Enterococcus sp. S22(2020)]
MEQTNFKEYIEETFINVKKENKELKKVNLLIAGKSGVGKSTLINAIFGEELVKTGVGKPVTDDINLIEQKNFPVRIYDTVGFEISSMGFDIKSVMKSLKRNPIQQLIKKVQATETTEDDIHVVWYVISGSGSRIEDAEIAFIKWIVEQKLPVIIVLTKSFDVTEANLLKDEIEKLMNFQQNVVLVLAKETENQALFGIEELIDLTIKVLPEGLQASFIHSQEASIKVKHNEAVKVVTATMAANFGTGFTPIPGTDAPIMMAAQTAMMTKITSIYGIDIDKQKIETALTSMLGVYTAMVSGKSLSGNIAKLVPGIGTVGGGLISGGVGMIITGALGYAYMELMELVIKGNVDLSTMTPSAITELLLELLPNYLPK